MFSRPLEMDDVEAMLEKAQKAGKIGARQRGALSKHAKRHTPQHIGEMLTLIAHMTFRQAHNEAMSSVGK